MRSMTPFEMTTSKVSSSKGSDSDTVFSEIHRVLGLKGRIQIADVTIQNPVSEEGRRNIDLWTG
jgi:hypothetical protein